MAELRRAAGGRLREEPPSSTAAASRAPRRAARPRPKPHLRRSGGAPRPTPPPAPRTCASCTRQSDRSTNMFARSIFCRLNKLPGSTKPCRQQGRGAAHEAGSANASIQGGGSRGGSRAAGRPLRPGSDVCCHAHPSRLHTPAPTAPAAGLAPAALARPRAPSRPRAGRPPTRRARGRNSAPRPAATAQLLNFNRTTPRRQAPPRHQSAAPAATCRAWAGRHTQTAAAPATPRAR